MERKYILFTIKFKIAFTIKGGSIVMWHYKGH